MNCDKPFLPALLVACWAVSSPAAADNSRVDLSTTPIPFLKSEDLPPRVGALIELGRGINEVGELSPGIDLPTGAVWQPALWVYGQLRVAGLVTDGDRRTRPGGDRTEAVTRLDLFANLQLSGTERILIHTRPLDKNGNFTGKIFTGSNESALRDHTDFELESFFFEGDIGEMFPNLDPEDRRELDLGFSVGRFPVEFQNGYLISDQITAVGLAKTNVQFPGSSGVRILGLWGFDHINRSDGSLDDRNPVDLFGLFMEGDFPWGLVEFDVAGTVSGANRGDQVNVGASWIGHSYRSNYSFHANLSQHTGQNNSQKRDHDGLLLVAGYSAEINPEHDIMYANGFWASGDFGRLASTTTPILGPVGLSYAGVGMGGYRPALFPLPVDSVGFSVGVQKFFADEKVNWTLEFAHRQDLEKQDSRGNTTGTAVTTRFQRKFANRFLFQLDAYYAVHSGDSLGPQDGENDDDSSAVRFEVRMAF